MIRYFDLIFITNLSLKSFFADNSQTVEDLDLKTVSVPTKSTIAVILSILWASVCLLQILATLTIAEVGNQFFADNSQTVRWIRLETVSVPTKSTIAVILSMLWGFVSHF